MNAYSISNTSKHIVSKPNKYIAPSHQHFKLNAVSDTSVSDTITRHKHILHSITSTLRIITSVDLSALYKVSNTTQTCVTFNYLLFLQIITHVN